MQSGQTNLSSYTAKSQDPGASSHGSVTALNNPYETLAANKSCFSTEDVNNSRALLADAADLEGHGGYAEPTELNPEVAETDP